MNFELKCCGKKNPLGVDKQNIRLSFALSDSLGLASYEVQLRESATDRLILCQKRKTADTMTLWVDPACLQDQMQYHWKVIAYLENGQIVDSETAYFETGLGHWTGQWINGQGEEGRVQAFYKDFCLESIPKKARLYICGLGYFSAKINGRALDDAYFIPPVTDYSIRNTLIEEGSHISSGHRVNYYTYDIADFLCKGNNGLYVEVAGGYYSNREKNEYEPQPDFFFGDPCLIYELHLEDEFGCVKRIVSGTDTQVRSTNEISRLYSGDVIDFTEKPAEYGPASLCAGPTGTMTAPGTEPDRVHKVLTPVASWQTPEGTVYDFGVNHSGGLCFTAEAEENVELAIRYAEVLKADGSLNFETAAWHGKHNDTGKTKQIYQQNTYRLQIGSNRIKPKFSWFCYRYILIPNYKTVHISSLQSLFIHMDVETNGSFSCSEDTLCRIHEMFRQTLFCNIHSGLVMDCPHRERLPYTGDGKLIMRSASYSLDTVAFWYKWLQDLFDAQTSEGLIPNSAPYFGGGGGYAWGNAICSVSQQLYCFTGDPAVAQRGYVAVKQWLAYYAGKRDENYIIRSNSHTWMLGDWLAPYTVSSDVYYISTVCYLQAAKTALFFAKILDNDSCEQWQELIACIVDGINRVFFHEQECTYGNGVQGENMLALAEQIVPEAYRSRMEEALRHHYTVETDYHLDTGIVLTPMLIEYLTDHGFGDIAYRIMTSKTYPSYFSLMENDTTFSEHWSKKWPDYYFGEPGNSRLVKGGGELSHCHPMFGSVVSWLYERVAGLDLSNLYQKVVQIRPCFMEQLTWARAKKRTAFGEVAVEWSCEDGKYTLRVCVPRDLTAHCRFPAKCQCLQNTENNQFYYPDEHGYYDFALDGGCWILTN